MNATGDHPDGFVRRIQTDVSTWTPERGPRWGQLYEAVRERPARLFRVYAVAGMALAAILVVAFLAMTAMNLGSFATAPVVSNSAAINR